VRVEFEFLDGTTRSPSPQAFSYFPGARGFFRYACPCHSCSGEFDLSGFVAELAGKISRAPLSRTLNISCTGIRAGERIECPICARIRVSTVLHGKE